MTGPGRPSLPEGQKRTRVVTYKLSESAYAEFTARLAAEGLEHMQPGRVAAALVALALSTTPRGHLRARAAKVLRATDPRSPWADPPSTRT